MHLPRMFSVAAFAAMSLGLLGCGGSDGTYYIPADNEIRPFTADTDDVSGDADSEELEDEGGEAAEGSAGAESAPAPAPAAAPAKGADKPAKGGKGRKPEKPAGAAKSGSGAGSP